MIEVPVEKGERTLERRLEQGAAALGVRPSLTNEWAWVVGRTVLVGVAGIGVVAFLRGTPPFAFMLSSIGFVLVYNAVLAGLLLKNRVHGTFFLGLVLDTVLILMAWAVTTAGLSEEPESTDIYLIMFPIVVVAVVRLGALVPAGGHVHRRSDAAPRAVPDDDDGANTVAHGAPQPGEL